MVDQVSDLKLQHLVELSKLGDELRGLESELEAWLAGHDVVFAGHTIPFVLMPHFVSPRQMRHAPRRRGALRGPQSLLRGVPRRRAPPGGARAPTFEDSLVIGPGYPRPLRSAALDAFLAYDAVRFLEFNADSPAGIGYTDVLYEGLRRTISLPRVDGEFDAAYEPMLPLLIETLLDAYRAMRAGRTEDPSCRRRRGWRWWTFRTAPRCRSSGSSAPPRGGGDRGDPPDHR